MVFLVLGQGRVVKLSRAPGIPDETATHMLLDQVIPRVLGLQGRVLIHGSAVASPEGRACAFVGMSGRGKSTLAASFYRDGWRMLADDCIQLDIEDGSVLGLAAYPKKIDDAERVAPLLEKMLADYAATGLPPAYVPKDELTLAKKGE